jgi:hypothetical protein
MSMTKLGANFFAEFQSNFSLNGLVGLDFSKFEFSSSPADIDSPAGDSLGFATHSFVIDDAYWAASFQTPELSVLSGLEIYSRSGGELFRPSEGSENVVAGPIPYELPSAARSEAEGVQQIDDSYPEASRTMLSSSSSSGATTAKPFASIAQLADYLIAGFWQYEGTIAHHWATTTITYNINGLTNTEKLLAQSALNAWHEVANITFVQSSSSANITFNHNGTMRAYETDNYNSIGIMSAATIDISADWITTDGGANDGKVGIDSYGYQTYVHEIGHALGLGHQGPYNGSASYSNDALYANDTWQYSVMSYFAESNYNGSTYRYVITPQIADIYAVQAMYGAATTRADNTTYGFNNTASSIFNFNGYSQAPALSIYDSGGADTLDCSGYAVGQTIDLHAGNFSSIGGLVNNIGIALGCTIEIAVGGSGSDRLVANDSGNTLNGGAGDDVLTGGAGNDTLIGGQGNDAIDGGGGNDSAAFTGILASYAITNLGVGTFRISGANGNDTVANVEFLVFSDQTVNLGSPADVAAPVVVFVAIDGAGITNGTGSLNTGKVVTFTVTMSEAVIVTGGTPLLLLNDGGTAVYSSGSGTGALSFSHTVAAGQATGDLAISSFNLNGATLRDPAGNNADLSAAANYNPIGVLQVDAVAPFVAAISAAGGGVTNGNGSVNIGKVVTFTVTMSEAVTMTGGTPTLLLNDGGTAIYSGGSSTSTLTFSHTVAAGQATSDLAISSFNLNGATLRDPAGNNADLSAAANYDPIGVLQVDAVAPFVTAISIAGSGVTNGNGNVNIGRVVTFTVAMSEAVIVTGGTPTFLLNDGGTAIYSGGSGTGTLTFSHTVVAGQTTSDLAILSFNLDGATLRDPAGNAADLSAATNYNPIGILQVDAVAPFVAAISLAGSGITNGNGRVNIGKVVTFTVTMNEAVIVTGGTPTLLLNDGGLAIYSGGSGTSTHTFSHTIAAGQATSDLAISSFNLNGATLRDPVGSNADLSAAANYNPVGLLQVDGVAPSINSISAVADGAGLHVGAEHLVTITMVTSEVVIVTGTPSLQLNDNQVASYTSGSGTSALTFTYAVQPGDNVAALTVTGLNLALGAAVQDLAGNGLSGSVTTNLGIQIDTTTVSPTSVLQEILGLYAAVYNRAAEFPGLFYWVGVVSQQADSDGLTIVNAGNFAITHTSAQLLGQAFVNSESSFFNQTYGGMTDSQFINALYVNIGGNAGDAGGIAYWTGLLQQAEGHNPSAAQIQAARAGLAGQFVDQFIDVDLSAITGLTPLAYQAALQRQGTLDNKILVSQLYSNATQRTDGGLLIPHTIGDAAYQASISVLQSVTSDESTVTAAIIGINNAVTHHDLTLI